MWWPSRSRILCCPSQLWARKAKQAKFQNLNLDFFSLGSMTLVVQGYSKGSETSCVASQGKGTLALGLLQSLFSRDVDPCSQQRFLSFALPAAKETCRVPSARRNFLTPLLRNNKVTLEQVTSSLTCGGTVPGMCATDQLKKPAQSLFRIK